MKVLAKIIDIAQKKTQKGTDFLQVTMMSGDTVMQPCLWSGDLQNGLDKPFRENIGKEGFVDLEPEVNNEKIRFSFGYDKSFDTKTAGPSLAKTA